MRVLRWIGLACCALNVADAVADHNWSATWGWVVAGLFAVGVMIDEARK